MSAIFSQYLINVAWHARKHEQFAFARERGFGVEIEDFRDPKVFYDRATLDRLIVWYREQLPQVQGLISIHGPYEGIFPGTDDPDRRAISRALIGACFDVAEATGASRVVFHVGGSAIAPEDRAGWLERQAANWRDVLAGHALEVMLENEWGTWPELLRDAVDAVGLPAVGACFDAGHGNLHGQSPAGRWVEVLGPRIRHLHLHDNAARHAEDDEHLLPGYGSVNWGGFAAAMRAQRLCVPAVIELGSVSPAKVDTRFLDQLNGGG